MSHRYPPSPAGARRSPGASSGRRISGVRGGTLLDLFQVKGDGLDGDDD